MKPLKQTKVKQVFVFNKPSIILKIGKIVNEKNTRLEFEAILYCLYSSLFKIIDSRSEWLKSYKFCCFKR